MIKPVTFKAAQNFKANLYALEVKSRFIDQNNANGYYKGYGDELAATVIGTSGIKIGSGAFLVQARMIEIVSSETVSIAYEEGKVGYILCRIETTPATNVANCSLVARTGASLSSIAVTKEDTYAYTSEDTNKIFELPLYSFGMQNSSIRNVVKLIGSVAEHENIGAELKAINQKISAAETRLNNLGFKSGSVSFNLPDGWNVTENKLTRQGNYVIGSFSLTPAVFSINSDWWSEHGKQTLIGTIPTNFRPKENITVGLTTGFYFYNIIGSSVTVNNSTSYGMRVLITTDGNVYLICEGETPIPQVALVYCKNFGFESPAIT